MPPYVPDMTRSARDQQGYAEPPFSPSDTPQARQAMYANGNRAELPFTPAGLQDWSTYDAADGDYTGSCLPYGLTRSFNAPYPYQILQSDTLIAVLFELNTWHHLIHLAEKHPADLEPTWFGHSIGRWDGDTLVVDTIGFNGYTRLDTIGHPHSAALHVTQTFKRTDGEHIAYTVTIDDPTNLHQAVEERAGPHVAQDAADRVLVRGEQQEPVGWADQGVDAAMGEGEK